jgi:lipopolysaccharide biosynthesis regulator YciM
MKRVLVKCIWTVLFLLFSAFSSFAANTIMGMVYDNRRNPIFEVDVELLNDLGVFNRRTRTDTLGRYSFDQIPDGRWKVRVLGFKYDFEDQTQDIYFSTFSVTGGTGSDVQTSDFVLFPRKGSLQESEYGLIFAQDVPKEAEKLYQTGLQELSKKRQDQAIEKFRESLKLAPGYYNSLFALGKELIRNKEYGEAAQLFLKAASVNSKSAYSLYYLAVALHSLGKEYNKAAITSLTNAHIIAPSSIQVLYLLGKIERIEGKFEASEKHLLQAKKLLKTPNPEIHKELSQLYANDLKKYKEAAEELELYLKAGSFSKEQEEEIKTIIANLKAKVVK